MKGSLFIMGRDLEIPEMISQLFCLFACMYTYIMYIGIYIYILYLTIFLLIRVGEDRVIHV